MRIADHEPTPATLICLCGKNGSGKTRILQTLAEEISDAGNTVKVIRVGVETVLDEMIDAIRFKDSKTVLKKYKTVQVLLLDNLWILRNKPAAAESICRLIAERQQDAKSTIVASETPVEEWGTVNKAVAALLANAVIYNV